jgi:hypothetical protein
MATDPSENLTEAASPLLDAAGNPAAAGVVIGPYELLQLIGEGGMGRGVGGARPRACQNRSERKNGFLARACGKSHGESLADELLSGWPRPRF